MSNQTNNSSKAMSLLKRNIGVIILPLSFLVEFLTYKFCLPILFMNIAVFFICFAWWIIISKRLFNMGADKNQKEKSTQKTNYYLALVFSGLSVLITNGYLEKRIKDETIFRVFLFVWIGVIALAIVGYTICSIALFIYTNRYGDHPGTNGDGNHPGTKTRQGKKRKGKNVILSIICFVLVLIVLSSFIAVPIIYNRIPAFGGWFQSVQSISQEFREGTTLKQNNNSEPIQVNTTDSDVNSNTDSNPENKQLNARDSFIYYLCLFAVVLFSAGFLFIFLYNIFYEHFTKGEENWLLNTERYKESIIAFSLCLAFLNLINNKSEHEFELVADAWKLALGAIFLILTIMTVLEVVRIALEQNTDQKSLLGKSIRFVFLLVLESFFNIIIGVFQNLHFQKMLEAIFSVPNEDEEQLVEKVSDKIKKLIEQEIEKIYKDESDLGSDNSTNDYTVRISIRRRRK